MEWVPQAKLVEKCPKSPKFRLFQNLLKNKLKVMWYQNLIKIVLYSKLPPPSGMGVQRIFQNPTPIPVWGEFGGPPTLGYPTTGYPTLRCPRFGVLPLGYHFGIPALWVMGYLHFAPPHTHFEIPLLLHFGVPRFDVPHFEVPPFGGTPL